MLGTFWRFRTWQEKKKGESGSHSHNVLKIPYIFDKQDLTSLAIPSGKETPRSKIAHAFTLNFEGQPALRDR
jgi:hypothetical protein